MASPLQELTWGLVLASFPDSSGGGWVSHGGQEGAPTPYSFNPPCQGIASLERSHFGEGQESWRQGSQAVIWESKVFDTGVKRGEH